MKNVLYNYKHKENIEMVQTKKSGVKKKAASKTSKAKTAKTSTKNAKNIKPETKKSKIIKLIICIIIPLLVGGLSALITGDMMSEFGKFNQPILSPPGWLFPIAWSILYVLMGIASYCILIKKTKNKLEKECKIAWLVIYGVQLVLNFFWSIIFFSWGMFSLALFWLLAMWVMILVLLFMANRHSQVAMWCLFPYALWTTFAAYLNLMIMMLN